MTGLLRMAVRFVAIATTIAAIAMIFVPSPRTNSPYLSALSSGSTAKVVLPLPAGSVDIGPVAPPVPIIQPREFTELSPLYF